MANLFPDQASPSPAQDSTAKQLDAATIAAIRAGAPHVKNGTYTVSHPTVPHFTVKLYTAQKGALAGRRLLALLMGPNNQTDFKAVAFWDDAEKTVRVWERFRGQTGRAIINGWYYAEPSQLWSTYEHKLNTWCGLAVRATGNEQFTMQLSARCVKCNRELTDPLSLEVGQGPECRKK